jgi:hypothetical protein
MTAKLGDLFPKEDRDEHAERLLAKGAVLRLYSTDINNRKIKRLIIIGFADQGELGKIYINSNPQSDHSQIQLGASSRDYLEHDSYVDCSRIYEDDRNVLLEMIKADLSCCIGQVSSADMERIESFLKAARTIPLKQKRRFGLIK